MLKSFSDFINCKGRSDTLKLMKNSHCSVVKRRGEEGGFYFGSMVFVSLKKKKLQHMT